MTHVPNPVLPCENIDFGAWRKTVVKGFRVGPALALDPELLAVIPHGSAVGIYHTAFLRSNLFSLKHDSRIDEGDAEKQQ